VLTFNDLCNKHGTDKGDQHHEKHGYSFVYDENLLPLRNEPINILEIGVFEPSFPGASLQVLKEYFPRATIYGMDVMEEARKLEDQRVTIFIGDQGNPATWSEFHQQHNIAFDVVIDDGSHRFADQMVSFQHLFPRVARGGIYFIEDLHGADGYKTRLAFNNYQTVKFFASFRQEIQDISFHCDEKLLVIKKCS